MTHIKPFIFSAIVLTAILWLTLSPDPLPDNDLPLFDGMDKIVHACMFGGLYFALRFDLTLWTRRHGNTALPLGGRIAIIAIPIIAGGAIELLQESMVMGRGCEFADFLADIAGVVIAIPISRAIIARLPIR